MLDTKITLFDVSVNNSNFNAKSQRLKLCFCKAIIYNEIYSEFEESTFANINSNSGFGCIDYEFGFDENFSDPYMKFYVGCFAIKCSSLSYSIKLNSPDSSIKFLVSKNYTKINKNGKLAIGIRYYFQTPVEKSALIEGNEVLIEGNISFANKHNIYDIMCKIIKLENSWSLEEANTYRMHKRQYIYNLFH